ncbi:MAG: helix-turn-helix domain-containing protein [Candidatus Methanomethylophilaceae archaeon]|jgi:predicted transcriptional regulator|nr:helix-turn-helix domain-containing protein [Candidatus Methanomethylophilaceae archaeon]
MDIDMILNMISNPTRRRILESLTKEPSYPLQLSKEIGVSQQAIMKNLELLERNGMVIGHQVSSAMGPMKVVYEPTTEFTVVIDMRRSMFSADVTDESGSEDDVAPITETIDELRSEISRIDKEVEELERQRSALIRKRQNMISWAMSQLDDEGFTSLHKSLMYQMLNNPDVPEADIIRKMSQRTDIERSLHEIAVAMRR